VSLYPCLARPLTLTDNLFVDSKMPTRRVDKHAARYCVFMSARYVLHYMLCISKDGPHSRILDQTVAEKTELADKVRRLEVELTRERDQSRRLQLQVGLFLAYLVCYYMSYVFIYLFYLTIQVTCKRQR